MLFKMTSCATSPIRRSTRADPGHLHADTSKTLAKRCARGQLQSILIRPCGGHRALYGPLHRRANEAVIRMLTELGSIKGCRVHQSVKPANEDDGLRPSRLQEKTGAKIVKRLAYEVSRSTGRNR